MESFGNESLVERCTVIVRNRMAGQAAGHGMDHVLRVLATARTIRAETGGDLCVIELAALLHDVGDAKFHDGVERSAEFASQILGELGAAEGVIEHVAQIVDNISFRKAIDSSELSLEGKIVQDADRLDALGAIGIVRTIEYGAAVGQPFYLAEQGSQIPSAAKTGVGHFHEKLFKLKGLMNTDAARCLAEQRERFMRLFLEQFFRESSGEE